MRGSHLRLAHGQTPVTEIKDSRQHMQNSGIIDYCLCLRILLVVYASFGLFLFGPVEGEKEDGRTRGRIGGKCVAELWRKSRPHRDSLNEGV